MKNKIKTNVNNFGLSSVVRESVKGFIWSIKEINSCEVEKLSKKFSIDEFFANILVSREVNSENYKDFNEPKLKNILPNPSSIKDVDDSTKLIVEFIIKGKKIGLFGDYDVDGASSTALFGSFFKNLGVPFEYHIPDRIKEGYGPNIQAIEKLFDNGCELIITLDCGTTSNKVIEHCLTKGIKIIVIDHHQQIDELPNCLVVNPNRIDDDSKLNNLAAVGVTFLLLVSVNRCLKLKNFYKNLSQPNLIKFLDLVALGTICDIVQLDILNRALVIQGIKVINETLNLGIKSLLSSSNLYSDIDEYHLGYIIGPKINAGGRVGNAKRGVELLLSNDISYSKFISDELSDLNIKRQKIEKNVEDLATIKVDKTENILCVHNEGWHPGVIGIVASRLTDKFSKPSIVISENDQICKGSARSIGDFNIGDLISEAVQNGILESGGGHKMAGGLSIQKSKIKEFKDFIKNKTSKIKLIKKKYFDAYITINIIDFSFYNKLQKLSPFGPKNRKPRFCFAKCFIKYPKLVGNNHVSCFLSDIYGNVVKAIAFKVFDNKIRKLLMDNNGKLLGIIGTVNENKWNGQLSIQIQIEDILV